MGINQGGLNSFGVNQSPGGIAKGQATAQIESRIYARGQASATIESRITYGSGVAGALIGSIVFARGQAEADILSRILEGQGQAEALIESVIFQTGQLTVPIKQTTHHGKGQAQADFQQEIAPLQGVALARIQSRIVEQGQATAQIEQDIHNPRGQAEVPFEFRIFDRSQMSPVQIQQSVTDGTIFAEDSHQWTLQVSLGGVDISENITGQARIEAEEDGARICELTFDPEPGVIDITTWVGQTITVNYLIRIGDSGPWSTYRIFTGLVDVPEYDPVTQLVKINATDNLQVRFEQTPREDIDNTIQGFWSEHVFGNDATGWTYLQEQLSTIPYSYDLDVNGTGSRTAWAAKAVPDFEFTNDDVDDETIDFSFAARRDVINEGQINVDFRFERLQSRDLNVTWEYGAAWCDWLVNPWRLPTKTMIESALGGAGYTVKTISFVPPPPAQAFLCTVGGGYVNWLPSQQFLDTFVIGFYATLQKRWSQTITERYKTDVRCSQSISQYGALIEEFQFSLDLPTDTADWEQNPLYFSVAEDPEFIDSGFGVLYRDQDDTEEGLDRTALENAQETAIGLARTKILDAHRQNFVTFSTLCRPDLERFHTVFVNTTFVQARGKVFSYIHTFNIDAGTAATDVKISISKVLAVGLPQDDPVAAPQKPDTAPTEPPPPQQPLLIWLGGLEGAQPVNEVWRGMISNYQLRFPGANVYPYEFRYEAPEVDEQDRQEVEGTSNSTVNVEVPDELLTITTT